jgi:hypothetical protein
MQNFDDDDDFGDKGAVGEGKGGSSCHQCKSRRNLTALTYCSATLDKKNKKCRKKFCGHCLKKFYKESPVQIANKGNWQCPSCRKICCCAACKRRKTKGAGGDDDGLKPLSKKKKVQPAQYRPENGPIQEPDHDDNEDDDEQHLEEDKAGMAVSIKYPRFLLGQRIKIHAQEAADSGHTTPFAKLYAMWKENEPVQTRIRGALMRADFPDTKKVEIISGILAQATATATVPTQIFTPT